MDQNQGKTARDAAAGVLDAARRELGRRVIGQAEMLDGLLTALIAGGHALLEGVPGLAKTRAVKALAEITALQFRRIQFTPDLLPADLTGTLVWEQATGAFSVRRGPVFANVVLADEINRAPAKVQSALLEAMEERQVTIGETSHTLPDPFFVLATQNPIEHEGTYPLPDAELDRFLLKLRVDYPEPDDEVRILGFSPPFAAPPSAAEEPLRAVLDVRALRVLRAAADSVYVDPAIQRYVVAVTAASRGRGAREGVYRYLTAGASPRASLALYRCARVHALFAGRAFAAPEDVKAAAYPVLRHRLTLSYEAEADGLDADEVVSRLLALVPAP